MPPSLFHLLLHQVVGGERNYGNFLSSYARTANGVRMSIQEAANLNSAYWISFSVGRFLAFLAANWVPMHVIIMVEGVGVTTTCLINRIIATPLSLWIISQPQGIFWGPLYPSGIAWANLYFPIHGRECTMMVLGASAGGVVYTLVMGQLYDEFGPGAMTVVMLWCAIIILGSGTWLRWAGLAHGSRFEGLEGGRVGGSSNSISGGGESSNKQQEHSDSSKAVDDPDHRWQGQLGFHSEAQAEEAKDYS